MERIAGIVEWNIDSIILACAIAAITGPIFALTHECAKWLITLWRQRPK